jgi:hypothetical protein
MQAESTKKSPRVFSGTRFFGFAMIEPPATFYARRRGADVVRKMAFGFGGIPMHVRPADLADAPAIADTYN